MEENKNTEPGQQPENISKEKIVADEKSISETVTETPDIKPQTAKEMEVHHHAHTPRKKWTHYFWEFLMLFLAVFCGFLAEYQLEHKIEKDREKIYMQNMLEDLQADTAIYLDYARRNAVVFDLVDTITLLIKSPDRKKNISKLAYAARIMTAKWKQIELVKRTYEQMKSSGHLRLIGKRQVADSVSSYYSSLSELDTYNDVGMIWADNYAEAIAKVFDGEALLNIIKEKKELKLNEDVLLTEDRLAINELITSAGYFYGALSLNQTVGNDRSKAAQRLIELIKKEYHLK